MRGCLFLHLFFLLIGVSVVSGSMSYAEPVWVDPGADPGLATGDRLWPFSSVADAIASGRLVSGGSVHLLPGRYGDMLLSDIQLGGEVVVIAEMGGLVHATSIQVRNSSRLTIEGLSVWPTEPGNTAELVGTDSTSEDIAFRGLDIRGRESAADYVTWTKDEWIEWRYAGVFLRGPQNSLENSSITAIGFGVAATGREAHVEGNVIRGFSGDAIRGLGDFSVFKNNYIADCILIDDNHSDGFQSWSLGLDGTPGRGIVRGIQIDGNFIHEWSSSVVSPYRCSLQGVGMFDGPFVGAVVQNNVILVSAYHGIMIMGAVDCRIVNNTVLNSRSFSGKAPWIGVADHKNGVLKAERNIIANNVTHSIVGGSRLSHDGKPQYNLSLFDPSIVFVNPSAGSFVPIPGGRADGTASPFFSPKYDISGKKRGAAPDMGAIEGEE